MSERELLERIEVLERKVELLHRRLVMVEARPTTWENSMAIRQRERQRAFDNSWTWPPDDSTVTELREQIFDERARGVEVPSRGVG